MKSKLEKKLYRVYKIYVIGVLLFLVTFGTIVPVYAADDPISVVNNLSDFIFALMRAIGMIMLGFGVVQFGLSLKSHDPSQRANSILTVAGGIIITFSKEIINMIAG